jgi:hypothetical protein
MLQMRLLGYFVLIMYFLVAHRDPNLTRMSGPKDCGRKQDCFQLQIPMNQTMLQAYNCDRQKPGQKTEQMPAEKQIYRPDYVKHHFIVSLFNHNVLLLAA